MTRRDIGKCIVQATFDDTEAGEVSTIALQSNSETSAAVHWEAAGRETQCACGKSFAALEANMRIGGHLRELRKILPHGEFGREVKAQLGFDRQWSARLMQLHEEWPYVLKAIELAKSTDRLRRSELGVDRALTLLAAWRRETASGDNSGSSDKSFSGNSYVPKETISKKKLIEQLKKLAMKLLLALIRARRHIAFLESEIERLSGAAPAEAPCPDQFMLQLPEHIQ
jgi:hypothetical protein